MGREMRVRGPLPAHIKPGRAGEQNWGLSAPLAPRLGAPGEDMA